MTAPDSHIGRRKLRESAAYCALTYGKGRTGADAFSNKVGGDPYLLVELIGGEAALKAMARAYFMDAVEFNG